MPEKPILIIHPNDKTTYFLNKIKNHLIETYKDQVHNFNIHPNRTSHDDCLKRIVEHSPTGLIVFLGHGRSDKLFGSRGDLHENIEFVSPEAISENPDSYYYNNDFINEGNVEVFKGKKVFCLSCNSNDRIGKFAMENEAISFFGFGDIPTSAGEFKEKGKDVGNDLVTKMKTELSYIIKKSLAYSIQKGDTFQGLLNTLRFITNQRISEILTTDKNPNDRYLLTDYLYYLKREATIYGDRNIKMLDS